MNQPIQNLANIPFFIPEGPATSQPLKEGLYLAKIDRTDVKEIKNIRKLLVVYEVLWAHDITLHDNIGRRTTEFLDLEGEYMEIGSEKINRLRIVTDKIDSKSSSDFEGEYVMLCMKTNKKNNAYTNVAYIAKVPDEVKEAYNAYVENYNAELEAKSKTDESGSGGNVSNPDYDPDVGF